MTGLPCGEEIVTLR